MVLVMLLAGATAQAGDLLCGLSEADVQDVIDHYNMAGTVQDYTPYLAVPFDCGVYGDLCEDLGAARAEQFVCARWEDGLAHLAPEMIDAAAESDYEFYFDAWEAERFPDGIPANDPWFGVAASATCSKTETAASPSGTKKVTVRARTLATGIYNQIKVYTIAYEKSGSGGFRRDSTGSVGIDGYFYSTDAYGVCDQWDPALRTDTDGRVGVREWTIGIGVAIWPDENVEGAGFYYDAGLSATACKTAWWNHC